MSLIPSLLLYQFHKTQKSKAEQFGAAGAFAVGAGFALVIPMVMILNIVFLIWAMKLAHRCRKYGGKSILHYLWAWIFNVLYIVYAKVSGCSKAVNVNG